MLHNAVWTQMAVTKHVYIYLPSCSRCHFCIPNPYFLHSIPCIISHPPFVQSLPSLPFSLRMPGTRLGSCWARCPPRSCTPSMPRPGRLMVSSCWLQRPTRQLKTTTMLRGEGVLWLCTMRENEVPVCCSGALVHPVSTFCFGLHVHTVCTHIN